MRSVAQTTFPSAIGIAAPVGRTRLDKSQPCGYVR
jgi:hypothetical protein